MINGVDRRQTMEHSSSSIRNACQNPKLWCFYRSSTLILVYKPLCNEENFLNFTSLLVLIDDPIPPFPQLFFSHWIFSSYFFYSSHFISFLFYRIAFMQFSDRVYFRPNQNHKYGCCIFYENISLTQAPPSLFCHFHHNLTMQYSQTALQIHAIAQHWKLVGLMLVASHSKE